MKKILGPVYYLALKMLLSLRYRIKVKGLENLPRSGVLFLANHPAEIDPCILLRVLWPKFQVRPIAVDYLFRKPFVRYLLDFIGALPVPNFDYSANSFKKRQIEKTYTQIFTHLDNQQNLLIYPAGGLKNQAEEVIGGASGVHNILQKRPGTNVVLVRTTGLWGSSFSRALTGKTPDLFHAFLEGFKIILKNGIFFAPRREVTVECVAAPKDFPWKSERIELNRYLENWYNSPAPESLNLVSSSFWKKELPDPFVPPKEAEMSIETVPDEIRKKVLEEVATLTKVPIENISPHDHLATDLGLDSLDMSQLVVAIKEIFGVSDVSTADLTTVGSLFVYAARVKQCEKIEDEEEAIAGLWEHQSNRPAALYPDGRTIPEVFLQTCERMKHHIACVDKIAGEVSYNRLKIGVILLTQKIQKMRGERIGILLPASTAVNAVILATMLAGKIPVMINWTLGERNLHSIIEQSNIQTTLSSWSFLDRLDNIDLAGLDDQILLLEDVHRAYSLFQKIQAFFRSKKSVKSLLKSFGSYQKKPDDTAVILFTSGTESLPKGVPLSHSNIISNQKGANQYVNIQRSDVMLGALPPFHSFGFSVTGLLPLLVGLRVVYFPNPTDGKGMARAIEKWGVTVLCLAPTFLKNLLRIVGQKQLVSLGLAVVGAEKAPTEIFEMMKVLNANTKVIEGYGITECAPILTLNPPDQPAKGVGIPLPGVDLLIVHPETHAIEKEGSEGLILASGPNIFHGYLNANISSPFLEINGKKWYQTGDLGSLDVRGYLTLSGRLKRFIKIGGEMISLGAIEEILLQCSQSQGWEFDPKLPSLAVYALEKEGKKGEIHLFTIFKTTPEEVNSILRKEGMSNLVKVRSVTQLPYIPLLGSGKIDYRKLLDHLC